MNLDPMNEMDVMGSQLNLSGVGVIDTRSDLYSAFMRPSGVRGCTGPACDTNLRGMGDCIISQDEDGNDLNTCFFADGSVVTMDQNDNAYIGGGGGAVSQVTGQPSSSTLTDYLKTAQSVAPAILQAVTTAQLSQINLDRAAKGLPPLTTGQVLGVAGAPPAITPTFLLIGALAVAFMLRGGK